MTGVASCVGPLSTRGTIWDAETIPDDLQIVSKAFADKSNAKSLLKKKGSKEHHYSLKNVKVSSFEF